MSGGRGRGCDAWRGEHSVAWTAPNPLKKCSGREQARASKQHIAPPVTMCFKHPASQPTTMQTIKACRSTAAALALTVLCAGPDLFRVHLKPAARTFPWCYLNACRTCATSSPPCPSKTENSARSWGKPAGVQVMTDESSQQTLSKRASAGSSCTLCILLPACASQGQG